MKAYVLGQKVARLNQPQTSLGIAKPRVAILLLLAAYRWKGRRYAFLGSATAAPCNSLFSVKMQRSAASHAQTRVARLARNSTESLFFVKLQRSAAPHAPVGARAWL